MAVLKESKEHFPEDEQEDPLAALPDSWKPAPKKLDYNVPEYKDMSSAKESNAEYMMRRIQEPIKTINSST